jgi:hypothetical protein
MKDALTLLITTLIGAGGATFVATLIKGWSSLRSGARSLEKEAVADLARARDEAEDRCRKAVRDGEFWRSTAGSYAYQLIRAGKTPDPPDPVPPSERIH